MAETPGALVRRVAALLRAAFAGDDRSANAELDARLLVGHALGLDATAMALRREPVTDAEVSAALALGERRVLGEPVARIIGRKGFWTLDLALSPETLVPRPDTETVVSAALEHVRRSGRGDEALTILDLGTGSGAILLALLAELPAAVGLGIDRAEGAVRTARENAAHHGFAARARFVVADWAAPLAVNFDLVVSNPPYIPRNEIGGLAVDVRTFDPDIALDGGVDGLDAYRIIVDSLEALVAPGGAAFLEVGAGQADDVSALVAGRGFRTARHRDLAGIERVVEVEARQGVAPKNGLGNRRRSG